MDRFPTGQRSYSGYVDRRMDIVSGDGDGRSSTAARRPYPLDLPSGINRASWPGQGAGRPTTAAAEKPWGFTDSEMRRKRRIARYKAYGLEGKVKASLKRGIRWIKDKCSQIVNGH
ncbi:hypothetical protein SAY87_025210 [Trapa incisa]|uniref:DUF3511 domain protein n=1 Tax=Trapa incisa TaxID=236973 RepID=A0AAN7JG09_9MYRT|nr:hypothetical protein SAY87_025210 [Trapa incisa]